MATVLQRDIVDALRRLRAARATNDKHETAVCERRLNWLLDRFCATQTRKPESDYENANTS